MEKELMTDKLKESLDVSVQSRILYFRGMQVVVDRDLADLYGVETKRLNEAVKRNIKRFPERPALHPARRHQ